MTDTASENSVSQLLQRYWGLLILIAWGAALLGFGVIRLDAYGLDESAARGLLLNWSVSDNILNPIVTLGVPDFRAVLFIPLGLYWPGSIIAAKVFSMLIAFAAITMLYKWSSRSTDTESANIAAALLLISPLLINQVDAIGTGGFLLLAFALGAWLDKTYRNVQRPLGSWFFIQLIWVAITITIHPMGLAYPLAIAWIWHINPVDKRQQRHIYIGLGMVTVMLLVIRGGWQALPWLTNPIEVLALAHQAVTNINNEPNWLIAGTVLLLLATILWIDRRFMMSDPIGVMLSAALFLGLLAADNAWALISLTVVLFRGTPYLIKLNQSFGGHGLLKSRGVVLAMLFVLSTSFMLIDKSRARIVSQEQLSLQDELIRFLGTQVPDPETETPFAAASQWPGRTMIACKCMVFPLPPPMPDQEQLLASIKGITHMIFNPYDPKNSSLGRHIAEQSGATQTIALQEAGIVIKVRAPFDDAETDSAHNSGFITPATRLNDLPSIPEQPGQE